MASAQVLSNSTKKQEHLEAGKRRLEEFRKKKTAERAKKASSSSQVNGSEVSSNEKQPVETVRVTVSDGAGTSDGPGGGYTEASSVISSNGDIAIDFSQKKEHASSNNAHSSPSVNDYNGFSANQEYKRYGVSGFSRPSDVGDNYDIKEMSNDVEKDTGTLGISPYGPTSNHPIALRPQASQEFESNTRQFSFYGNQSEQKLSSSDSVGAGLGTSQQSVAKISPQNSVSTFLQSEASNFSTMAGGPPSSSSLNQDSIEPSTSARGYAQEVGKSIRGGTADFSDPVTFRFGEGRLSSSASGMSSLQSAQVQTYESTGYGYDARSSSNYVQPESVTPDSSSRRSRPSFLDTLNVSRASSGSPFQQAQPEESYFSNSSKSNGMSFLGSLPFHKPSMDDGPAAPHSFEHSNKSSLFSSAGVDQQRPIVESNLDRKHEFYSSKQNDDFAALEQHIEDLTQEKFSLQRALEASRSLAESLASENSSLTETYNQQRSVVDQLKSDLETLQEEIKAHMVELEAVRNEYANAQLECNAADERSKLLASEVIGLEEKALRLRSSELKLERQLENSQAEISSYKKRLSSLEKDRSDLQSTISALQEEKKLLQSMLRKASTDEKKADVSKSTTKKKDVFTSTEDLDSLVEANEVSPETVDQDMRDTSSFSMLPENGQSSFEVSSVNIPPDQMRTIDNINTLVSELALEKEELIQSLASETSQCSKLKELNNELSRKLEAQTQRLELLTAQSMANESTPIRQPLSHDVPDSTPYADEGDEVVERVLGWIMKLFPGGPSRRRTSKLL
uniref:uncharacterized protein LOC101305650 n=1 Tax=Fragaria vesca subsp. vesca TaxID=101020 RepID=UPI0005CB3926|nr:PREDICTED: uncharacterized protein LOC101305650 [Fragaria vesca subsp. vesca]